MNAGGFVVAILIFGLCVYGFDACRRGFRRSRGGSRTILPYLHGAGMATTVLVALILLISLFLVVVGPIH